MQCAIYKSRRKQDTYLYLATKDDFSNIPDALLKLLGEPVHIMDLELRPDRKLAREDTAEVLRNLRERGWHLQMPEREEWPESGVRH
ncbi:MAG: YcgL domain-containing protein [Candidatus Competibacteraceae bacterium]